MLHPAHPLWKLIVYNTDVNVVSIFYIIQWKRWKICHRHQNHQRTSETYNFMVDQCLYVDVLKCYVNAVE